ncbi:MAG: alpha/beta hydrolase [Polaromonas sp.]|uniref:alpha/beta hydrolase n=1 Tax=Polaromonas sp. TaxID=1869339 RepID=UPI00248A3162|nr:alpha/beta hydrolase [Polaromonas sp.]MDI1239983.1 alpha/beta hydrolase [Polaromonas sp.]
MDKEIEALLQRVKEAKRAPFWQGSPQTARSTPTLMRLLFGEAPAVERIEDLSFASADGVQVPARLYIPSVSPKGLIVFFHGGGWVIGSVTDYHPFTAALALRTGCAVLSVDYRLAPEHPFPKPVEDAVAALAFAAGESVGWLGGKPDKLVAMGDSAGATLATVASRLHNQRGNAKTVDLQVLLYPVTDAEFNSGSYREFERGYLLTRRDMEWFWEQYCPDLAKRRHPDASPMKAGNLAGSPPALLMSGGLDPLRDEGEAYGSKLKAAGIDTEVIRCEGLVHGFLAMVNYAPSAGRALDRIVARIKEASAK